MEHLLIFATIYVLYYTLNYHPMFDNLWAGNFAESVFGKLIRCPLCFAFWTGFIPAIILCYLNKDGLMILYPSLTGTVNQLLAKIIIK